MNGASEFPQILSALVFSMTIVKMVPPQAGDGVAGASASALQATEVLPAVVPQPAAAMRPRVPTRSRFRMAQSLTMNFARAKASRGVALREGRRLRDALRPLRA